MKFLKIAGISLAALALLAVVVGFFLPKELSFSRSIVIQAPVERVFPMVNNLREFQKWSPFASADPEMTVTFNEIASGVGASSGWKGAKMGEGSQTITQSVPNSSIEVALVFGGKPGPTSHWSFMPKDGGVEVTWGYHDTAQGLKDKYMPLLMPLFSGMIDKGLTKLKELAEAK